MNLFGKLSRVIVGIAFCSSFLIPAEISAQQLPPPLPIDTALRMGQLENGLTYFIRRNTLPEGRADFYIAQRVGSMQEEDSQSGLAHFLEHIAFNGTKNFPGKNLISWLESIGVGFGSGINAYTGFDETVYTLKDVPVSRTSIVDSCLLILHDWSNAITLEDKEIDNERGVIQEEWRSRDNGDTRAFQTILQKLFPNNKYGKRMPIGSMDVVRNFKYKELRDYYKKWYRPDLQALIIVGDIDVNHVEATIKKQFADVPKPVNPAERVYVQVEDNDKPIIAIATDPEAVGTSVSVSFKTDVMPREIKATAMGIMESYVKAVVSAIMTERFAEITKKPNAPFTSAYAMVGPYGYVARSKDALTFDAQVKDGQAEVGLKALVAEIERLRQFGFTEGEYKRASKNVMASIKTAFNERDKRKNNAFTTAYVEYFTKGGSLTDIATEYAVWQQLAEALPVEQVNAMVQPIMGDKNVAVTMSGPSKPELKYPTEAELEKMFVEARKQPVEAYKEAVSDEKLLKTLPKSGKVVKEEKNGKFGATVWTLSNGVKVVYKTTDFKEDQILLSAVRHGGTSAFPKADPVQLRMIDEITELGGLGDFDETALSKALTGRVVSLSPYFGRTLEGLNGSSSKDDLETLMQLIYMNFTAHRLDKEAYQAYVEKRVNRIESQKSNPMSSLSDSILKAIYPNDILHRSLTADEVKNNNYEATMKLYAERMTNAKDFVFLFVGNIEPDKFRPLVERYIASLPVNKKLNTKSTDHLLPLARKGEYRNIYTKKQSTPAGVVFDYVTGVLPYNQRNVILMNIISEVLNQIYIKTIREEEGGTYGASTSGELNLFPQGEARLQVFFQTDPEKAEHLNKIVYNEMYKLAKEGAQAENFDKAVEQFKQEFIKKQKENNYWLSQLSNYYFRGVDNVSNYDATLSDIKIEEVGKLLQQLLNQNNRIEVVMMPEK